MNKNEVQAAFVAAGLSRVSKDLDVLSRASIRLFTTAVDESSLHVGVSKVGGMPDLPPEVSWPEWKNLPQSFVAQLRLDELHRYDVDGLLPSQGMLWFFYDAQQQTFGEKPADRGGWKVFFWDGDLSKLHHTPYPTKLPDESRFHACSLRFAGEIALSQQPKLEIANFDWTDEEQKRYEDLLSTFPTSDDHAAIHDRVLGYPDTLQDDMRLQCQLVSQGITDEDDPRVAELSKGTMDWCLLLQLDSDEHAGMRWGSSGMLYFWIKQSDLQTRRFDATWAVLQSD